ncbi:MAG TPA: hypothetical protein VKU38_16005 [Ktedonobacteraceae bacterium]|nr:hypothetical protein [Ktedonobacteraceae bacterium]
MPDAVDRGWIGGWDDEVRHLYRSVGLMWWNKRLVPVIRRSKWWRRPVQR